MTTHEQGWPGQKLPLGDRMTITHKNLVEAAKNWLVGTAGCAFSVGELVTYGGEMPDAIGFKATRSIVIECKMSRSDFHRDRKKPFRANPESGLGDHRYFLCPEGIIKPEDDLCGWGLLWLLPTGKIKRVVCPVTERGPDFWHQGKEKNFTDWSKQPHKKSISKENILLVSITRRLAEKCPYIEKNIKVKRGRMICIKQS